MSKAKRILLWSLSALLVVIALAAMVRIGFRPQMPDSWHKLHTGMQRTEVLAIASGEHTDMRELKGFDVFTHPTTKLGSPSYWQLDINYDQSGHLSHAEARFIHRSWNFLSQAAPQSVL